MKIWLKCMNSGNLLPLQNIERSLKPQKSCIFPSRTKPEHEKIWGGFGNFIIYSQKTNWNWMFSLKGRRETSISQKNAAVKIWYSRCPRDTGMQSERAFPLPRGTERICFWWMTSGFGILCRRKMQCFFRSRYRKEETCQRFYPPACRSILKRFPEFLPGLI